MKHPLEIGRRRFRVWDTSLNPHLCKGEVDVRGSGEEADKIVNAKAEERVGHKNYRVEELVPTLQDKVAETLDRMAYFLKNS